MEPAVEIRPGIARTTIRRRWRWVVAFALTGLAGGFLATVLVQPAYTATAVAFLDPLPGNPYSPETSTARSDQLAALETEAALMSTPPAGERAAAWADDSDAGVSLPDEPETHVRVSVPSNAQILRVTFQASDPDVARAGAQAVTEAHLAHRSALAEETAAAQVERLNVQAESTQELLDQATAALAEAEESDEDTARTVLLQQQIQTYSSQIAQLQLEISAARGTPRDPGEVISPATAPDGPDGLPEPAMTAAGLLGGFAVGLLVALWREHTDDRLHESDDITTLGSFGVGPVLSTLPSAYPLGPVGRAAGKAVAEHARQVTESFRLLRTAVLTQLSRSSAVLTVSGVTRDVEAVGVANGLAQAVERSGRRVALVLVDAAPATLPPSGYGLSDLLRRPDDGISADTLDQALVLPSSNLAVLGPGRAPLDSEDLVSRRALDALLAALRKRFDLVVLAAPATTAAAGQTLSAVADGVVLVAQLEHTTHDELLDASETLTQRQARVIGIAAVARPNRPQGLESDDVWQVLARRSTDGTPLPSDETVVFSSQDGSRADGAADSGMPRRASNGHRREASPAEPR